MMLVVLRHALGMDQYGIRKGDRSHFVTGGPGQDLQDCLDAVEEGFMRERTDISPDLIGGPGSRLFLVTDKGLEFVIRNNEPKPKVSKAKERYRRWLSFSDCFDNFLQFCYWDAEQQRKHRQLGAC